MGNALNNVHNKSFKSHKFTLTELRVQIQHKTLGHANGKTPYAINTLPQAVVLYATNASS